MVKPITPAQVVQKKKESLPDEVIEATNEMIAEHWNGTESTFKQPDLVKRIVSKWRGVYESADELRRELFAKHYLDIEDVYKANGWNVIYDKPGYSETGDAYFTFKRKMKSV